MNASVSVLLPVHNGEAWIEQTVVDILDLLPELTDRFQLLIIDNGSVDETIEIAEQLARAYPQVTTIRLAMRFGLAEAVQAGLDQTQGDVVFVGDEHHGLQVADLVKLWPARNERELVLAQSAEQRQESVNWLDKLFSLKPRRRQVSVQMIRRRELDRLAAEEARRRFDPARGEAVPQRKSGPIVVPTRETFPGVRRGK